MGEAVDFFISLSGKDKVWGDWIAWQLKEAGYTVRYQHWDFQIGESFLRQMERAGREAKAAVLVLSPHYFSSDFTQLELHQFLYRNPSGLGPGLLPVKVEPVDLKGSLIGPYAFIDLTEAEDEEAASRLLLEGLKPKGLPHEAPRFPRATGEEPKPNFPAILGRLYGDVPRLPDHYHVRREHLDEIRDKLLEAAAQAVGVVGVKRGAAVQGMGGVGKTVLAAAVLNDEQVRAAFPDGRVWLTFGQRPDVDGLQRRLLQWVAPKAEPPTSLQHGRDTLAAALKNDGWLIVLDDIWRRSDLAAFEVADTPSRFLITTRNDDIVRASGAISHVVDELAPDAARAFLAEAIGVLEAELPPEADRVIEECGCLPLALAITGASLADDPGDANLWRDVIEALAQADHDQLRAEFEYPYAHPFAAIQASVDFLREEERSAYLDLAVFPEDAPIPSAPLAKLWGVSGLKLRNRVKLYVERALARRQKDGSIRLHDLQGDFVRARCADVSAAHDRLLEAYRPHAGPSWAEIEDDGYILDWLPHHLGSAGRHEELLDLLFDLPWLRRKLSARDANAIVADTGYCADDPEGEQLGRALRMSAHVLDRDPAQLSAQLCGRLRHEDGERTARLWDQARTAPIGGVLIPRQCRHLLPPGPLLRTLLGHSERIFGALESSGGGVALSWSDDQTLRLWDLESGTSRPLEGHSSLVYGAVELSGGGRALSWSGDQTLRLWDLESGTSRVLEGHSAKVEGARELSGGGRALSWSGDQTLRLWDLESGTSLVLEGHCAQGLGAVELAGGGRALSWSWDGMLRLWDLESGTSRVLKGHSERVLGAVELMGGGRALSWSADRMLRLWDLESGTSRVLKGHSSTVLGAVELAGGGRAVSWSGDGTLRLWNLKSGTSRVLKGHAAPVFGAAELAVGGRVLSWSWDKTLRLWDLDSGMSRGLEGHSTKVLGAVELSGGGRALSWSWDGTVRLWDLESATSCLLEGHSAYVSCVVELAGGGRALSSSWDGTLRLWDLGSWANQMREGHSARVSGTIELSRGGLALSWSNDQTLRLWDPKSCTSQVLEGHGSPVTGAVELAGDGRVLSWSGGFDSRDHTLRLWNLKSGTSRVLKGHAAPVFGAAELAVGGRVLSWSWDKTLRLWDLESGTSRVLKGHNATVSGAFECKGGGRALSWSYDQTLRLWDLKTGTNRILDGHSAPVSGAMELSVGGRVLSWSRDGIFRLWDLESGASQVLEGHAGTTLEAGAVELARSGRALSWSGDGALRLWDLASGASRVLEGHRDEVVGAVELSGGDRALSWSRDRTLRLWDLESGTSLALEGHRAKVEGAVELAGGGHVLSWSRDGMLWLWELATLNAIARFVGDDPITCCVVSSDGRHAIAGDSRGRVLIFDVPE